MKVCVYDFRNSVDKSENKPSVLKQGISKNKNGVSERIFSILGKQDFDNNKLMEVTTKFDFKEYDEKGAEEYLSKLNVVQIYDEGEIDWND